MADKREDKREDKRRKKQVVVICNLIDWSRSFVDPAGSFYCGTTGQQKQNAARILRMADLVISAMDLHPVSAPEHSVNGGLYPVHNAVNPWEYGPDFVFHIAPDGEEQRLGARTLSPRLTEILAVAAGEGRKEGILVPRGVYFQGGLKEPFCGPGDIEETFRAEIIGREDFLGGDYRYITAPKQYFDATRLDSDIALPQDHLPGVPDQNFNIYSLLTLKFPPGEFRLVFINTGVVEGICRLHTSIGMRQLFPFDRIINISDATTPLYGVGLGYATPDESRQASMRVCKDIGIEYMSTADCLSQLAANQL